MAFKRKRARQLKAQAAAEAGPAAGASGAAGPGTAADESVTGVSTNAGTADKSVASAAQASLRSGINPGINAPKRTAASGSRAYANFPSATVPPSFHISPEEPAGFPVSSKKFWIMSVGTYFYYPVYWAYRNFRLFLPTSNRILAGACAILLPFTLFYLIKRVKSFALESGIGLTLRTPQLALSYFLTLIIFQLFINNGKPIAACCVGTLSIVPLYLVQRQINNLNRQLRPALAADCTISSIEKGFILILSFLMLWAILREMSLRHWINISI